VFARGRSKNAPTDNKMDMQKTKSNPDRFQGLSGFFLFRLTNWNLSLYYFYKLFKIINLNNVEHIPIGKMIYIIPNRT